MTTYTRVGGLGTWIKSAPVISTNGPFTLLHLITDDGHHSTIAVPSHLLPGGCRRGDTLRVCYRRNNGNGPQGAEGAQYIAIRVLSRTPAKLWLVRGTVWKSMADGHKLVKNFETPAPGGVTRCRVPEAMFDHLEFTPKMQVDLVVAHSADTDELIARAVKTPEERFSGEYKRFNWEC